jgi:hypothetical protein
MIELLDSQTSGNDWSTPRRAMLHELPQESPVPSRPRDQRLIFNNFEQQMMQYEADHQRMIAEIRRLYVLPAGDSVELFLSHYRAVTGLLLQAIPKLREFFGSDTLFSLRVPIDDSGTQTLYAVAMWPGRIQDVKTALDRFDDSWWIPNSRQASGYLTFTYELV